MRAFNKCGPQLVFSHSTQRWHQLPSDKLGNRQRVLTRMRVTSLELRSREVTRENFAQFGQLVMWQEDGMLYSEEKEARLDIASGQPRLYIMRLRNNSDKEINFTEMNFHANSTQTLGSLKDEYWYLAVASATFSEEDFPQLDSIQAFRIPGTTFVNLNRGTWHAGPLFLGERDFLNLELTDTNVTDRFCHHYSQEGVKFTVL